LFRLSLPLLSRRFPAPPWLLIPLPRLVRLPCLHLPCLLYLLYLPCHYLPCLPDPLNLLCLSRRLLVPWVPNRLHPLSL
jgi:hypothetical protein